MEDTDADLIVVIVFVEDDAFIDALTSRIASPGTASMSDDANESELYPPIFVEPVEFVT
jgi:hypothetical protein